MDFVVLVLRDLAAFELLILWLTVLVLAIQVQPQLEPIGRLVETGRHLSVDDALASCHPLHVSWAERALVSNEVLVHYFATQHVGHCLHPAMWVVWKSCGQLHVEIVEHQEWIQVRQLLDANEPFYFHAYSFRLFFCNKSLSDFL